MHAPLDARLSTPSSVHQRSCGHAILARAARCSCVLAAAWTTVSCTPAPQELLRASRAAASPAHTRLGMRTGRSSPAVGLWTFVDPLGGCIPRAQTGQEPAPSAPWMSHACAGGPASTAVVTGALGLGKTRTACSSRLRADRQHAPSRPMAHHTCAGGLPSTAVFTGAFGLGKACCRQPQAQTRQAARTNRATEELHLRRRPGLDCGGQCGLRPGQRVLVVLRPVGAQRHPAGACSSWRGQSGSLDRKPALDA